MNLTASLDEIDDSYVYLCDPIRNNVLTGGHFIRFIYSPNEMIMNGLYIYFSLTDVTVDKFFAKSKFSFSTVSDHNKYILGKIISLEHSLLSKYKNTNKKTCKFSLSEQFSSGVVKIHDDLIDSKSTETHILLKISGIWEAETEYGLTFKCSKLDNTNYLP